MWSMYVANLSQQKNPKQISNKRKHVCDAVPFQDKMKHIKNNLLWWHFETLASMARQHQHVNANLHLYQQQPNFSLF